MRRMWTRAVLLGALGLAAGGSVGCASERDPINRVQPNALAKSFFVGSDLQGTLDDPEFYEQATLVDVGYGASQEGLFTSTYAQPLARIKWQITETLLIGRLTYQRIANSDGKGAGPTASDGVIAVAYRIQSHFDIKRDYNPATGEEMNVIVENSTDRPWNEREYMRVDWSQNVNTDSYDFDMLSLLGIVGGVTYEPLAYYVNDPNDENSPHFDPDSGYFDITSKAFATPVLADISSLPGAPAGGKAPLCNLDFNTMKGTGPAGSCDPVELTIRQSFKRVVDDDYEPVDYDGYRFQAFGAFTTERYGYARDYGMTDANWHHFIDRYNIWERSHYYDAKGNPQACYTPATLGYGADPHADADGDGTDDVCAAVTAATGFTGSKCDTFKQRCTLPYRARTQKPIVWYYTKGSNTQFFDGTDWAAHEWDVAMRGAVVTAKYAECVRSGDPAQCALQYPMYTGQMEDNWDARELAKEVDDCRHQVTHPELQGDEAGCQRLASTIGTQRGYSSGVISIAAMPEMVVLCHSPVEANDPAPCAAPDKRLPPGMPWTACAQADTDRLDPSKDQNVVSAVLETCNAAVYPRRGDMRYNQINALVPPQTPSPWGIMVDSNDPLTGEKVATSVNVWTHVNDLWSQSTIDNIRYLKGELKTADVTDGTYIDNWAQAAQASAGNGALPLLSKSDLDQKIADFNGISVGQLKRFAAGRSPAADAVIANVRERMSGVAASAYIASTNEITYNSRRATAISTDPTFEAALMTGPVLQYSGYDQTTPVTDDVLQQASPLRGANRSFWRNIKQMKDLALAQRGACILEDEDAPAPFSVAALADILEQKFGAFNPNDSPDTQQARAEKMRQFLAQRAQYAVIAHEMGHSIGLRHNFLSSANAWGYRPQYWALRTNNGKVTTPCTDVVADGDSCVGPRYFDPVTKNERDNLIWTWMQSSIMDYAGEWTQDTVGIGAYDYAAARMFYGDVVAVHADPMYKSTSPQGQGMLAQTDNFGGIIGLQPALGMERDGGGNIVPTVMPHGYSDYQVNYKLITSCENVADPSIFRPAGWNDARDGTWSPLFDGQIVSVGGQPTRCKGQPVDYQQWTALRTPTEAEGGTFYRGGNAVDKANRTRVPYGFATDTWADLGNISVYRHDNGADPYEIYNFMISQPEVQHIFDNYRRGRTTFSVRSAADRILTRYNEKMRDGAKGLGLFANLYRDVAAANNMDFDQLWSGVSATQFPLNVLAAGMAFDHFAREFDRPEPGPHFANPGDPVLRTLDSYSYRSQTPVVVVPNGASGYYADATDANSPLDQVGFGGKPVENALASDKGEYNVNYTQSCGSYYDKANAAMLLTESVDNFISSSRQDFTDGRYRAVGMADLFQDGYRRWLANNLTGDDFIKGPRLVATSNGRPAVAKKYNRNDPTSGFPAQPIGWTSWLPATGPASCFPSNGTNICVGPPTTTAAGPNPLMPQAPANVAVLDPQVGWEQQKFLIAWTLMYLPESAKQFWLDRMQIFELGADADPGLAARIEFHDPSGKVYVAQTFGTEVIFGKTVQKGVGARILEWANTLMGKAYQTTPGPDLDGDGQPDWLLPVFAKGAPVVTSSASALLLTNYMEIPYFMRQAIAAYHLGPASERGVY